MMFIKHTLTENCVLRKYSAEKLFTQNTQYKMRKAKPLTPNLREQARANTDQMNIAKLHQSRLVKYAKALRISEYDAIGRLIALHRSGEPVAFHISSVLGVNHSEYIAALESLNESKQFIR